MERAEDTTKQVILLGAGASAATVGPDNAPTCQHFGRVLHRKVPNWHSTFPFLKSAVAYLAKQARVTQDWSLDAVWNGIDENFKLSRIIENQDYEWPTQLPSGKRMYSSDRVKRTWGGFWVLAGWELRRALTQIYGAALSDLLSKDKLANTELAVRVGQLGPRDVTASMNYDLLAENVATAHWPNASNCLTDWELSRRNIGDGPLILKPHGSLDWQFRTDRRTEPYGQSVTRTNDGSPLHDEDIDVDENQVETRPLLVAPVRYKDEIVFPDAQPPEIVEVLTFQWRRLVQAVSEADELQVLGYRFPEDDSYGNRMLQEAARRRKGPGRLTVLLYLPNNPPSCECAEVKRRLEQEVFPGGSTVVQCCGPIPSS